MKTLSAFVFLCMLFCPFVLPAQDAYRASRTATPPAIDGLLGDDCWVNEGEWSGAFVQQQPNEGSPETEETHLKIVYDNHNVYVAFQLLDTEPEKVNRWLAPRDQIKGDVVAIVFDSYDDKRTGFAFALTAAGAHADFLCQNAADDDYTWNAVWEGKTSVDERGWYAEFRIPLSQLRYASGSGEQEWGMHAIRFIDRKMETDHLHLIPRNNKGLVFSFGRLRGISGLPRSRRIELTPYTSLTYAPGKWNFGAGLDGKVGLSSDFTLDLTLNPDFGQVEADPSTMNLSAYETYYDEKRPFFLEGKNIFAMTGESMFYSRRIGAPMQGRPAHIISAVKVSGKGRGGLSLGLLNSLTSSEHDRMASYSVARLQQDINNGNTVVGGLLTSVNRSPGDASLTRHAYTGGVDFGQYFLEREFYLSGSLQYSYLQGSREAMTALQRSPVHYYQREGASHIAVDSTRTHLEGSAGTIRFARFGGKALTAEVQYSWATPGFDPNDVGYLQNADYQRFSGYVGYMQNTPAGIFRNYYLSFFYRYLWDFGGTYTFGRAGVESNMSFMNKWYLYLCGFYDPRTVETSMLRGGTPVLLNPRWGTDMSFGSDQSKAFWMKSYHGTVLGDQRYAQFMWVEANYRPIPNMGLSARVNYEYWNKGLEYAGQADLTQGGRVYLMSALKQHTTGLTLRMDYSLTPDLSVQFYGNPFRSSGKYSAFKRATQTMDKAYDKRFRPLESDVLTYRAADDRYDVAEANGDAYTFANPDFSVREFRFNLVARWEYRPNSVAYLVWGQGNAGEYVSLKFNYWFAL
jgi:hypothetical protein